MPFTLKIVPVRSPTCISPWLIERDTRRNTKIASKHDRLFEWGHLVNNTLEPARDKHLAILTKSYAGRVWNVAGVLRNIATDVYAKKRDRQFFASRSGTRDKERAIVRIECRVGNRMKIAGQFFANCEMSRFTQVVPRSST